MRRYELAAEMMVVSRSGEALESNAVASERIRRDDPAELVRAIEALDRSQLAPVVVVLDDACSKGTAEEQSEGVIALASALVGLGVEAFETRHVIAVNRVFATHRAIASGSLGVDAEVNT